jgi:phosphohistidine phosphatase
MPRLFLLRHAKSSWDDPALDDPERPLTRRGVRAAGRMAALLAARSDPPRLALVSPARRTLDTLAPIRETLALRVEIVPALYLASPETIRGRLALLDASETSVLVIGHNPGLHELAASLAGRGKQALRERLAEGFPTGALAEIEVEAWDALAAGAGRLAALTFPRELD